jgi:hypothetical protein
MTLNDDGTTLLDTKLKVPNWIYEADIIMKRVTFSNESLACLHDIYHNDGFKLCYNINEAKELIVQVLRQDIRGVHQGRGIENKNKTTTTTNNNNNNDNNDGNDDDDVSTYMCRLDTFEIEFINKQNSIDVIKIKPFKD